MPVLPWTLSLLLTQSTLAPSAAPPAGDDISRHVSVRLSVRNGKTSFRVGEPVELVLTYSADGPGYAVENTTEILETPIDRIDVSPASGVVRWIDTYSKINPSFRDYTSITQISTAPYDVTFPLNYWFRFDEPGEYTVNVATRRVTTDRGMGGMRVAIPTNSVTFRIAPMTEPDEAAEARRLGLLIDSLGAKDDRHEIEWCDALAFLTSDAGTREKVRRFLNPPEHSQGFCARRVEMGFHISRSPELVLSLLEEAIADLSVPATFGTINAAASMRLWIRAPAMIEDAGIDAGTLRALIGNEREKIRQEYATRVVASLPHRTGRSRLHSAYYALSLLPDAPGSRASVPPEVRAILVRDFDQLDHIAQLMLVHSNWPDIRDVSLAPSLKRLLADGEESNGSILNALIDVAPEEARPFAVAAIVRKYSMTEFEVLRRLRETTLPEIDRPLLEEILRLASSTDSMDKYRLRRQAPILGRFASAAILADVRALYDEHGAELETETRAGVLAYLERVDPTSRWRVEQAIATDPKGGTLLFELARAHYSNLVDTIVRTRLDDEDPASAGPAAHVLSTYGPASARAVLEARLARWERQWGQRVAELTSGGESRQAELQRNLIRAILEGAAWTLTAREASDLARRCVTDMCRQAFGVR